MKNGKKYALSVEKVLSSEGGSCELSEELIKLSLRDLFCEEKSKPIKADLLLYLDPFLVISDWTMP